MSKSDIFVDIIKKLLQILLKKSFGRRLSTKYCSELGQSLVELFAGDRVAIEPKGRVT